MNRKMVAMSGLLAACATEPTQEDLARQVADDLATFEALELVDSVELVATDEASYAAQAERLHALVDLADDEVDQLGPCYAHATDVVEQSLERIEALGIVELGELLVEEAVPEPNCYNLPCPDEQARADAVNEERARILWHLAERSEDL